MKDFDFQKDFQETELKRITADILVSYINHSIKPNAIRTVDIDNICNAYSKIYQTVLTPNTDLLQQKDND